MSEKEISEKIYNKIINFSNTEKISLRKISEKAGVKYTTFMTWIENLKNGKCISVANLLKIEKVIGLNFFAL